MIDWQKIRTVLLDLDGTLLDLHYDNYFWMEHLPKRIVEIKGGTATAWQHKLQSMFEEHAATLNWYSLDFWADALDIDIISLKHEVSDKIGIRADALQFLIALQQLDVQVILATNAHPKTLLLKFAYNNLGEFFEAIHSSADIGAPKEQQQFWQKLQQQVGFDNESTLFIDDSEAVLESAINYGIGHVIAVRTPDSQRPEKQFSDMMSIDQFSDLKLPNYLPEH